MNGRQRRTMMIDGVMRAALGWFSLTTVIFWLPMIRGAFDGVSYQWASSDWAAEA